MDRVGGTINFWLPFGFIFMSPPRASADQTVPLGWVRIHSGRWRSLPMYFISSLFTWKPINGLGWYMLLYCQQNKVERWFYLFGLIFSYFANSYTTVFFRIPIPWISNSTVSPGSSGRWAAKLVSIRLPKPTVPEPRMSPGIRLTPFSEALCIICGKV